MRAFARVGWLLTLVPPGCPKGIPHPILGVTVERRIDRDVFTFHECGSPSEPVPILGVSVVRRKPGTEDEELICQVRYVGEKATIEKAWAYGSVPPGYKSVGCQPLVRGTTYLISILGYGGTGGGAFILNERGAPRIVGDHCKPKAALGP